MSGLMKTVLNSRSNRAFFFLSRDSKGDDVEIESKVSPFFLPPLVYLPSIAVLSLFFVPFTRLGGGLKE